MTIRPARITELDKIRKLNTRIFVKNAKYDKDIIPRFAETKVGEKYFCEAINREDGCFLVAEKDGELVGYVNGKALDILYRKSRYFEIENLGVLPEMKRQRLGTKLLEEVTKWAEENSFQKIYVESYAKNKEALAFYRMHGYKDIDISLEKSI